VAVFLSMYQFILLSNWPFLHVCTFQGNIFILDLTLVQFSVTTLFYMGM